jgi:trk system potassium uptake protein TrkA
VHVVVMGCGRVGAQLARTIDDLGHSVAVVDQDKNAFVRLGHNFGGRTVVGIGFDRDRLLEAGIDQAHAFAAVSSGDNSNILAARVARETFGVELVVARIYDPRRAEVYERLGIPTVASVSWQADRMLRRILPEDSTEEWRSSEGGLTMLEVAMPDSWVGERVTRLERETGARVAYLMRFGTSLLVNEHTVFQADDGLHVLVTDRGREASVAAIAAGTGGRDGEV